MIVVVSGEVSDQFPFHGGDGVSAKQHTIIVMTDMNGPTTRRRLISHHFCLAYLFTPVRSWATVSRSSNRIFINTCVRSKETGNEIETRIIGSAGDDERPECW